MLMAVALLSAWRNHIIRYDYVNSGELKISANPVTPHPTPFDAYVLHIWSVQCCVITCDDIEV